MEFDNQLLGQEEEVDNASQPTEGNTESLTHTDEKEGFDSDAMLDEPIENVGDVKDCSHDGKVKKEILEVIHYLEISRKINSVLGR